MIIVKVTGGRGNQIFQWAAARRLSYKLNTELKIDKSDYDFIDKLRDYSLEEFNIEQSFATPEEIEFVKSNQKYFSIEEIEDSLKIFGKCDEYGLIPNVVNYPVDAYFDHIGFDERYFADAAEVIRGDLTLRIPVQYARGGGIDKLGAKNSFN